MKKLIIMLLAMTCYLGALADEVPGLTINKSDGSHIEVAIPALRSIKFSEGNMIVNMKDDSRQSVSLDDIASITFEDVTAAIQTLTAEAEDSRVTVTDLAGRQLFQGEAQDAACLGNLRGVYVITINGKSHIVSIGK